MAVAGLWEARTGITDPGEKIAVVGLWEATTGVTDPGYKRAALDRPTTIGMRLRGRLNLKPDL
jgi:hypothetical protein